MKHAFVDTGSSINFLTLEVHNKLGLDKNNLTKVSYLLVGLRDKTVVILGTVNLPLVLGDERHKREVYAVFVVMHIPLTYNGILRCSVLNYHKIIINMGFLCLKLLALGGVAIV